MSAYSHQHKLTSQDKSTHAQGCIVMPFHMPVCLACLLVLTLQHVVAQPLSGRGLEVGSSRSAMPAGSCGSNSSKHKRADAISTTTTADAPRGVIRVGRTSQAMVQQPGSPHPALQLRPVAGPLGAARNAPRSSYDSSSSSSSRRERLTAGPPGRSGYSGGPPLARQDPAGALPAAGGGPRRPSTSRGSPWNNTEKVQPASPAAAGAQTVVAHAADVFYRHVSGSPTHLLGSRYYY
jgi:hypothetical protein